MDFLRAKTDYNRFLSASGREDKLHELSLGNLYLPSGKIVACDPLVCLGRSLSFNKTVPAGSYPVTAYFRHDAEEGERIALVKIEFSQKPVSNWEMALTEFDDISLMTKENDFFGFPVDSGLASFCDADTQELYDTFTTTYYQNNDGKNIYNDYFEAMFQKNATTPDDAGDWINFTIPHSTLHNVVMFSSGYGDGNYPCYWGMGTGDEICSLVVDFFVIG